MTASVLSEAKENGAQLVVSACTISHANLDSYQVKAGKVTGKDTSVPVIHLAELVAFALGHFPDRLAQLRTRAMIIGGYGSTIQNRIPLGRLNSLRIQRDFLCSRSSMHVGEGVIASFFSFSSITFFSDCFSIDLTDARSAKIPEHLVMFRLMNGKFKQASFLPYFMLQRVNPIAFARTLCIRFSHFSKHGRRGHRVYHWRPEHELNQSVDEQYALFAELHGLHLERVHRTEPSMRKAHPSLLLQLRWLREHSSCHFENAQAFKLLLCVIPLAFLACFGQ